MEATKFKLLRAVKENAYKLPNTERARRDVVWGELEWKDAFIGLFLAKGDQGELRTQEDDLLFFVWNKDPSNEEQKSPFTVRRWAPTLHEDIESDKIAWRETVFLNLIVHTSFQLTLMVCRQPKGPRHALSEPLIEVRSNVYASPTQTPLSINRAQEKETTEPEPCWPNMSFSVINFEDEFENIVLTQPDLCFAVMLAVSGNQFLPTSSGGSAASGGSGGSGEGKVGVNRTTATLPDELCFSGMVSHPQLQGSLMSTTTSSSSGIFSPFFSSEPRAKKVAMRGPGGKGRAEVAVSKAEAEGGGRRGGYSFFGPSSSSSGSQDKPVHIRCCLMNLSLPWETVAQCIMRTIPSS